MTSGPSKFEYFQRWCSKWLFPLSSWMWADVQLITPPLSAFFVKIVSERFPVLQTITKTELYVVSSFLLIHSCSCVSGQLQVILVVVTFLCICVCIQIICICFNILNEI